MYCHTSLHRLLVYIVNPVFKDHLREENDLVFVHRWSLITGSCMQNMSNWGIKRVVAIDRELLNKGGHMLDFCINPHATPD